RRLWSGLATFTTAPGFGDDRDDRAQRHHECDVGDFQKELVPIDGRGSPAGFDSNRIEGQVLNTFGRRPGRIAPAAGETLVTDHEARGLRALVWHGDNRDTVDSGEDQE